MEDGNQALPHSTLSRDSTHLYQLGSALSSEQHGISDTSRIRGLSAFRKFSISSHVRFSRAWRATAESGKFCDQRRGIFLDIWYAWKPTSLDTCRETGLGALHQGLHPPKSQTARYFLGPGRGNAKDGCQCRAREARVARRMMLWLYFPGEEQRDRKLNAQEEQSATAEVWGLMVFLHTGLSTNMRKIDPL